MHPRDGLQLDEEAAHYMPENRLENWEEYDEKVAVKLDSNEQLSKKLIIIQQFSQILFLGILRKSPGSSYRPHFGTCSAYAHLQRAN
jgi:hypothetical protein